jgi:hypothetical protein
MLPSWGCGLGAASRHTATNKTDYFGLEGSCSRTTDRREDVRVKPAPLAAKENQVAISWTKKVKNESGRYEWVETEVTHVGLVLGNTMSHERRVMSDAYADEYSVQVWDPEAGKATVVTLGTNFDLETRRGHSTIDALPEYREAHKVRAEAYRVKQEAAELQARTEAREDRAREELLTLCKGAEVVVVKGRKVPKGTRGIVSWMGDGNYGPRVGILTKDGDKPLYTAESNIVVVLPGADPDDVPVGGWVSLLSAFNEAESGWLKTLPQKGDKVQVIASGVVMKVGWAKRDRLGLALPGAKRGESFTWAGTHEVLLITSECDVALAAAPKPVFTLAPKPAPPAPKAKKPRKKRASRKKAVVVEVHPLATMPAPYCNIRSVTKDSEGDTFSAYDAEGAFLLLLPEPSARLVLSYLETLPV